ncbi:hypothetical protein QLQ09_08805 [Brucella sp. NM4]|uniref:hypothetical protein n=1 Tax=Brucella/Ochrobactrum group TaxID=2826938 RepID=UPI0024BC4F7B|nr:hypothetical protein [Brucella sp. NM4]WHS32055.1 hypothetical protein QLQ09_08805 [Brucella sp. NM4]WHT41464.1 hypothetical protein QLQ11_08580 [Ochrobactrum sp. SSR]
MNNIDLLNEYAKWIDDTIFHYANYYIENNMKINPKDFVYRYGYYITFNFEIQKMVRKYQLLPSSHHQINERNFKNVRFLYNLICREALGRNFMKNTSGSPLVIMCSDVNNTKFWSYSGDIINLHVHSIWISNPVININLDQYISNLLESDTSENFDFRDVHIERITSYDPTADAPSRIATYTAKFIPFNTHGADIASDIRILPEYSSHCDT